MCLFHNFLSYAYNDVFFVSYIALMYAKKVSSPAIALKPVKPIVNPYAKYGVANPNSKIGVKQSISWNTTVNVLEFDKKAPSVSTVILKMG